MLLEKRPLDIAPDEAVTDVDDVDVDIHSRARSDEPAALPGSAARVWLRRLVSEGNRAGQLGTAAAGVPEPLWQQALLAPVEEILRRPGKGFRGRLTQLAYRLGGGQGQPPTALAAMLEIIHAGSMIIDDIEDDSSERRGAPAVHKLHGVPLALNAGNWMYFAPLELVGALGLAPAAELRLLRRTTRVLLDCHYGQALDLGSRVPAVPQRRVADVAATISTLKTGRLLSLAAEAGATVAGASPQVTAAIAAFGEALGVGLQMLDDLGNLSGHTTAEKRYEDLRNGRVTWVWGWAAAQLDDARYAQLVADQERLAADPATGLARERRGAGQAGAARFESLAVTLRGLVGAQGRLHAHWHLREALARLRGQLEGRALGLVDALESEIARLEVSYG